MPGFGRARNRPILLRTGAKADMKKNRQKSGSLLADPTGLAPEITAKAIRTMPPNVRVQTVVVGVPPFAQACRPTSGRSMRNWRLTASHRRLIEVRPRLQVVIRVFRSVYGY